MKRIQRNVVLLVLYDRAGRVLLQHRGPEASVNPNRWGFFGGGIDPGETPDQALMREAYEELRYTPHDPVMYLQEHFAAEAPPRGGTRYYYLALPGLAGVFLLMSDVRPAAETDRLSSSVKGIRRNVAFKSATKCGRCAFLTLPRTLRRHP